MRVALLSAAKSIHTVRWAAALSQRGHSVAVFSLLEHKAPDGLYPSCVEIHYLKCGGGVGYWLGAGELKRKLRNFRPDILNAHYATGYGTLARRCGFRPMLLSVWGSDVYDFPREGAVNRRIVVKNLENATAVASTSHAMARRVKQLYQGDYPLYITPFGVDTDRFRKYREPPQNILTVGIVKSLEPKYGIEYLIRAYALLVIRLRKEGKMPPGGTRLEIYGSGTQKKALEKLAEKLNCAETVRFFGAVPHSQVPQILSGFNIFCAPSVEDSESFGVAAVEAMACEVPVVTSDADGFREVVKNGETGFTVVKRDYVTMANKLFLLACDPALRSRMGGAGRRRVIELYNWPDNVSVMENALTETVLRGRRPETR